MANQFSWKSVKKPILALAPMEGYTDSAFRQLVKKFAPKIICFTEFTSADALKYNSKVSFKKITFSKTENPLIVQLFGKKPEHFVEAIKIVEEQGAAGIDINMGCPAKKVIGSQHGSALIKNPDLAAEIVHNVAKNTKLPVSVKTRIGFSSYDEEEFQKFCKKLVSAGAKLITIHGRTTKQGYGGKADWEPMYKVKKLVDIPIIGNGDVDSPKSALSKLKNLDGVMVGRATFGNPLIMYHIYNALYPNSKTTKKLPNWIELAKTHIKLSAKTKGEKRGMLEMRKHLAAYVKGFPKAAKYRNRLVLIETEKQAFDILDEIKEKTLL
jgi:tRNA-dihydrouridine synthase B